MAAKGVDAAHGWRSRRRVAVVQARVSRVASLVVNNYNFTVHASHHLYSILSIRAAIARDALSVDAAPNKARREERIEL